MVSLIVQCRQGGSCGGITSRHAVRRLIVQPGKSRRNTVSLSGCSAVQYSMAAATRSDLIQFWLVSSKPVDAESIRRHPTKPCPMSTDIKVFYQGDDTIFASSEIQIQLHRFRFPARSPINPKNTLRRCTLNTISKDQQSFPTHASRQSVDGALSLGSQQRPRLHILHRKILPFCIDL